MGRFTLDMLDGSAIPKRGDLIHTNCNTRQERTWFVLRSHRVRPVKGVPRCHLWIERWWELEPELRMRLYQSAERAGGQRIIPTFRYPAKRKPTFEQLLRGNR